MIPTLECPFLRIIDFYNEYVFFCESAEPQIPSCNRAKYTVFREAFNILKDQKIVKLRTGKSGIPCCATCNNIFNTKKSACCKRDHITREVLLKLARLHLKQQSTERQHADNVIAAARKLMDAQPTLAYMDIDGQSVWAGNTPKFSMKKDRQVDTDLHIENRNIGVRVVCGPIDEYISVSTNNLIPGGANILVEVVRYAIEYLGNRLGQISMVLPKKLALQFDNSGEQKVC
jgi:hypothetical protein